MFGEEGLPFIPSKGKSILTLSDGGLGISRETGAVHFSLLQTKHVCTQKHRVEYAASTSRKVLSLFSV